MSSDSWAPCTILRGHVVFEDITVSNPSKHERSQEIVMSSVRIVVLFIDQCQSTTVRIYPILCQVDSDCNGQTGLQPRRPFRHVDTRQDVRLLHLIQVGIHRPDQHRLLNDHKCVDESWVVLDSASRPVGMILLHVLLACPHSLLVQPLTECLSLPEWYSFELAELDDVDGTDVVIIATQLDILLHREVVSPNFLLDQVRNLVVKAVLAVGANTDVQLKNVSQCSGDYTELASAPWSVLRDVTYL